MDELYEDLENYNDADEIERLRNENKDLRRRLEAQSLALEKLKNDYDKLIEEHKKLERNYSSLLKTARNEIERKTQTITNLNIDKDRVVLNYVTRGRRRNMFSQRPYYKSDSIESKLDNTNKLIEKEHRKKSNERDNKLIEESPSISNGKTKVKSLEENKLKEENSFTIKEFNPTTLLSSLSKTLVALEKKDSVEENKNKSIQQNDSKTKVEKKPLKLRDRRKSMPILSQNTSKIYSDEEMEICKPKETTKSRYPSKDSTDRRYIETNGSAKSKNSSKTPSLEDKGPHYHEPKVSNRSYRREHDRSAWDKYDISRTRRHSPERHGQRDLRYEKLDKRRTRVLVSPPYNKFDRYHSKNYRDILHYDKPQPYDFDKHKYYDEKPVKHKLPHDYEEPVKKRPRFEPPRTFPAEDKVSYEIEMENDSLAETLEQLESQYASCQSPDYEQMDALTSHPLKEIRDTASSPLEDPREKTNRYILRLDDKGMKILSTVVGRNVDVKLINREKWCLPKVNVPSPLVNKPLQCEDDLIKDIYADIDNPLVHQNITPVPDKIPESSNTNKTDSTTSKPNTHDKLEVHQITNIDQKFIKQGKNHKLPDSSIPVKVSLDKYKIPKIKHIETKILSEEKSKSEETRIISNDVPKSAERKSKKDSTIVKEKSPMLMSTHKKTIYTSENEKSLPHNLEHHIPVKGIVEGDLELSDETSDNTEVRNYVNKTDQILDSKTKDKEVISRNCYQNIIEDNTKQSKKSNAEVPKSDIDNISKKDKQSKPVSLVSNIKTRGSKKTQKQIEKPETRSTPPQRKRGRPRKDKEPKEKASKMKEIFGTDSSSLITPEDLGIVIKKVTSEKYVSFFEDAQDATDVEEIAKVKEDLMAIEKTLKPKDIAAALVNENKKDLAKPRAMAHSEYIDNLTHNLTPISCATTPGTVDKLQPVIPTFISEPRPSVNPVPMTEPTHLDKPVVLVTHSDSNKVSAMTSTTSISNPMPIVDPAALSIPTIDVLASIHTDKLSTHSDAHKLRSLTRATTSPASIVEPATMANPAPIVMPEITANIVSIDKVSVCNPIPGSDCYVNLNPGKVKDSDIVKTIIISTGIQPQCVETPQTENLVVNVERLGEGTTPHEFKFKNLDSLKALATSTPHKDTKAAPDVQKANESSSLVDTIKVTEQSESNVSGSQNENDVPDVRIFVRRRRRTRMKPAT